MFDTNTETKISNQWTNTDLLARPVLWYAIPTFMKSINTKLQLSNLHPISYDLMSKKLSNVASKSWEIELQQAENHEKKPSIKKVLYLLFAVNYFYYGFIAATSEIFLKVLQILAFQQLISFYSPRQNQIFKKDIYWCCGCIVTCAFFRIILNVHSKLGLNSIGIKIKTVCYSLVYRKILKLNVNSLKKLKNEEIVRQMFSDIKKLEHFVMYGNYLWIGPIQLVAVYFVMYQEIGLPAITGVIALLILVFIRQLLIRSYKKIEIKAILKSGERVYLMREIISGIQIIKANIWDKYFAQLVKSIRRLEVNEFKNYFFMHSLFTSWTICTIRFVLYVTILTYILDIQIMEAKRIYLIVALLEMVDKTVSKLFSLDLKQILLFNTLEKVLLLEELKAKPKLKKENIDVKSDSILTINNGSAQYTEDGSFEMSNVNIKIRKGSFIGITGPANSGKTTLFNLILEELPLKTGTAEINGSVSYCSQKPWNFPGTVKQNILCGLPLTNLRYYDVIKYCGLESDINNFPNGDETMIGKYGMRLSKCQIMRINLARSIYRDADLYLLDDPFAIIENHYVANILENCFKGFLKNKTVVLITNHIHILKNVDCIILLNDGKVMLEGCYNEIENKNSDVLHFLNLARDVKNSDQVLSECQIDTYSFLKSSFVKIKNGNSIPRESLRKRIIKNFYLSCTDLISLFGVVILFVIAQAILRFQDLFISYWVDHTNELNPYNHQSSNNTHKVSIFTSSLIKNQFNVYFVFVLISLAILFIRSCMFFRTYVKYSTIFHDNLFKNIISTTMKFYQLNDSDQILKLFNKDTMITDKLIPIHLSYTFEFFLNFVGAIVVIGILNYWLFIPSVFFCFFLFFIKKFYSTVNKEMRRLKNTTSNSMFQYLTTDIDEIVTLRSSNLQKILEMEFDKKLFLENLAHQWYLLLTRFVFFYIDIFCVIFLTITIFSFPIFFDWVTSGVIGMVITQAFSLNTYIKCCFENSIHSENLIEDVEHICDYRILEQESSTQSVPKSMPTATWPTRGKIKFFNVSLKYSLDDLYVIKNVTFTINSQEKVGIVGRIGSGKSSLISALLHFSKFQVGSVVIDGLPTRHIELEDLRPRISVIPKKPFIFSGSLRTNLDPFNEYTDDVLWNALNDVGMKRNVEKLPSGLSSTVLDVGFDVGQHQLICLARAILRKNKIVVLDEAIDSVDYETEQMMISIIKRNFLNCTVLNITHRLNTIMDFDRVMVLESGNLVGFDHPYILIQKRNGCFLRMLQETGFETTLINSTEKAFKNRYLTDDLIKL